MANLLYLVHRLPYPPDKGDKVRSYHLLQHLVQRHQVFLGTFVDDPADAAHLPALRALCRDVCAVSLSPQTARLRSLSGLAQGQPLTLRYYESERLHAWVRSTLANHAIDAIIVFSSSMAQYAQRHPEVPMLVDLVDVDSAKWSDYAGAHPWPVSWLYRREGARLLDYERSLVARAREAFLVSDREAQLLVRLAPECAGKVRALGNGVDAEFFSPDPARANPFATGETALVFTGAMDYWPNVDAVSWFAAEVLPLLRQRWPALRLHIVGRNPTPAVRALAGDAVAVTGTVPDVRPYLQHAAAVVAPLRLARGVQNKVLEAMAMARPVVCATDCIAAIGAEPGRHLLAADTPQEYLAHLDRLFADPGWGHVLGSAGRQHMVAQFAWPARLAVLDDALASTLEPRALAEAKAA